MSEVVDICMCTRVLSELVLLLVFALFHLLLRCLLLYMRMPQPCTVHILRGRTRVGFRVPRERGAPMVGFPAWPKICVLSQRWRQGLIFGRPAEYGGRLQVPLSGGNQAQVPGVSGKVRSHLPSTRRFLIPDSCHLDTDWTSGNRWAGRRCVEPLDRGFGCYRVTPELVCFLRILITFG